MNYNQPDTPTTLDTLMKQYRDAVDKNLSLNMSRGKPAPEQLDFSNELLGALDSYTAEDGTDARNYGILAGLPECRRFFGRLLDLNPEQMIIGGNSSLNMMYDVMSSLCLFGTAGEKPWQYYQFEKTPVKFLCPSPGYDRHFAICEKLGIEMIPVPILPDGPDMDMVTSLVSNDPLIKGMWCVPLHSNPEGVCYSDAVVERLASMETAAPDFRIFWDNAYAIHHIYEDVTLKNIIEACDRCGHRERTYYFFSTSKITFPGSGIAITASGPDNITELKKHISVQTIGHDKINQLRHLAFFHTPENVHAHMRLLADSLRPKFDMVLDKLEEAFGSNHLATWSHPKGGYFISLHTRDGCAQRTVALAKKAGVVLTDAGATYPYGRDEKDSNIRIAPSYPTPEELSMAMDVLILCVKIASLEKYHDIQL